ncbi:MAG TPA: DUF5655 domain-containing protein [Actinomycetota bacterium]|nr:DUF5655 domain-containing protein [Actinomycetota bacterium]
MPSPDKDLDRFFGAHQESRRIFDALATNVQEFGPLDIRTSKSQVAFWREHPFAWAWLPEQYLKREAATLVLTVGLRRRDTSPRWKQVVEPAAGRFTHHLELGSVSDIDSEVRGWLREAWEVAGPKGGKT